MNETMGEFELPTPTADSFLQATGFPAPEVPPPTVATSLPPIPAVVLPHLFSLSDLAAIKDQIHAALLRCYADKTVFRVIGSGLLATSIFLVVTKVTKGWGRGTRPSPSEVELDTKLQETLYGDMGYDLMPLNRKLRYAGSADEIFDPGCDVRSVSGDGLELMTSEGVPPSSLTLLHRKVLSVVNDLEATKALLQTSESGRGLLEAELVAYSGQMTTLHRDVQSERDARLQAEMRLDMMTSENGQLQQVKQDLALRVAHVARLEEVIRAKETKHQRLLQENVMVSRSVAESRDKAFSDMQRRLVSLETMLKLRGNRAISSHASSDKAGGNNNIYSQDLVSTTSRYDKRRALTSPSSRSSHLHTIVRKEINEIGRSTETSISNNRSRTLSNITEHELEYKGDAEHEEYYKRTVKQKKVTKTSNQTQGYSEDNSEAAIINKLRELLQGCGNLPSKQRVHGSRTTLPLTSKESDRMRKRVYKQTSPLVSVSQQLPVDNTSDENSGEFLSASCIFPSIDVSPKSDLTDMTFPSVQAHETTKVPARDALSPCDRCDNARVYVEAQRQQVRYGTGSQLYMGTHKH